MEAIQIVDESIKKCIVVKEQIENDCILNSIDLGGKTRNEYVKLRSNQLNRITDICERLLLIKG